MHPLTNSFRDLKDAELNEKINKLYRVLATSNNINVTRQAQMVLDDLLTEQQRRSTIKLDEELKKLGKTIDDVINIE
jgi:hypothetical protein